MSAAVNDSPHDLFPRPHLPLTGELHPVRREFERLLATGNAIALTFAMLACTVIYFWPREARPTEPPVFTVVDPTIIQPPPIDPGRGGGGGELPAIMPDVPNAIPEPVASEDLKEDAWPEASGPGDGEPGPVGSISELPVEGATLVVPPPSPEPDDFVPFDRAPALLSCAPPVYPAIVRDAGIDGTVHVRVLVGVNGKVKKAFVVDGPPALHDAALESARTALFEPALQGIHPVEAWVMMPITFRLNAAR